MGYGRWPGKRTLVVCLICRSAPWRTDVKAFRPGLSSALFALSRQLVCSQHRRLLQGLAQAGRVRDAAPGDIERRPVIDAGTYEGQAERDVYAAVDAEILDRYQTLVMVL